MTRVADGVVAYLDGARNEVGAAIVIDANFFRLRGGRGKPANQGDADCGC